jgi:hypothetical protein
LKKLGLVIEYIHKPYSGNNYEQLDDYTIAERGNADFRQHNANPWSGNDFTKETLDVKISVGEGSPSANFITSPAIREALAKAAYTKGRSFGHLMFTYHPLKNLLEYTHFFPVPIDLYHPNLGPKLEFEGKGIASIIETRALKFALKKFPKTLKVVMKLPSSFMQARLKKLGFNAEREIELAKFKAKLRSKVALDLKRARAKRVITRGRIK